MAFLSDSQKQTLSNYAFNASADFLNGEISKGIGSVTSTEEFGNIANAANTIGAITAIGESMVSLEYFDNIKNIGEEVLEYATIQISSSLMEVVAKATTDLIIPDTAYINSVMNKTFNDGKMSLSDALKIVTTSAESRQEQELEKTNAEEKTKKFEKLKEKVNNVKKWINEELPKITEETNNIISKYILFDADELESQVDVFVNKTKKSLNDSLDEKLKSLKKEKQQIEYDIGKKMGDKLVEKYNDALIKQAKKQQNEINKLKAKGQQLLAATIQFAKLQIMALTGINIP